MGLANQFTFFSKLIKARILGKSIPLSVGIHITNRCNFKCIYCYGNYHSINKDYLSTEHILSLINELNNMGTKWITLTGGEPLLRDDIEIIIAASKQKNIICSMNTNGSLIRRKINAVKKLDYITVSLDGTKESNDANRGKGSFELAMDGIKCLKENNIKFDVTSVITKNNYNDIGEIFNFAKNIGFITEFNLLQEPNLKNYDDSAINLNDNEIRKILSDLIYYKKAGYPIFYATSSRKYTLKWPVSYKVKILYDKINNFRPMNCYMGIFMCHIDADGSVYPCIQLAGKFSAFNFVEVGFKKAWENLMPNKKCTACYATCYAEFNQILDLKLDVLLNIIKQKLRKSI